MTLPDPSTLVLLASLVFGADAPPQQAAQDVPPVRLIDDGARVAYHLDNVSLESFLQASQPVLGVALQWDNGAIANTTLNVAGVQRCERAAFREAFDSILRTYDFLTWDDPTAPAPVIHVFRPSSSRDGKLHLPFSPSVLAADQLDATPAKQAPLYATTFTLQHVPADDVTPVLNGLLDPPAESIVTIARSNQLFVVASQPHLRTVRDVLVGLDVPGATADGLQARVAELEKQVADLVERLAKLEAAGAAGDASATPH